MHSPVVLLQACKGSSDGPCACQVFQPHPTMSFKCQMCGHERSQHTDAHSSTSTSTSTLATNSSDTRAPFSSEHNQSLSYPPMPRHAPPKSPESSSVLHPHPELACSSLESTTESDQVNGGVNPRRSVLPYEKNEEQLRLYRAEITKLKRCCQQAEEERDETVKQMNIILEDKAALSASIKEYSMRERQALEEAKAWQSKYEKARVHLLSIGQKLRGEKASADGIRNLPMRRVHSHPGPILHFQCQQSRYKDGFQPFQPFEQACCRKLAKRLMQQTESDSITPHLCEAVGNSDVKQAPVRPPRPKRESLRLLHSGTGGRAETSDKHSYSSAQVLPMKPIVHSPLKKLPVASARSVETKYVLPLDTTADAFMLYIRTMFALPQAHCEYLSYIVEGIFETSVDRTSSLIRLCDEIANCKWRFEQLIGQGSFGAVYKAGKTQMATEINEANEFKAQRGCPDVVAIKCIDLEASTEDIDIIAREALSLSSSRCPQLIQFYSATVVHGTSLWLVMEYVSDGSVATFLDRQGPLNEDVIAIIAREVLLGLSFLARSCIMHRDLKAANVLLSVKHNQVKLCDLGACRTLSATLTRANTLIGSPYHVAPELLLKEKYTNAIDVWSLGVLLYECAIGQAPHAQLPAAQAMQAIVNSPSPSLRHTNARFSSAFLSFVDSCFIKDPSLRPSVNKLLKSDFIGKAKPLNKLSILINVR